MVLIRFLCNGNETQKLWKPLLTQFSFSEAHRNALHNGLHTYSFSKSALKTLGADLAAAKHKNSGNYREIVSWYMGEGIYIEGGLG